MNLLIKPATLIIAISLSLIHFSCDESPSKVDPCDDNEWVTATKNGEAVCLSELEVTYFYPNTNSATIVFTAGNELVGDREIEAEFSIPVEGIELNTDYPIKTGKLYGADPIQSGFIRLLVFDPPAQGKPGCISGTFSLKAGTPNGPTTFEYTNGRFVYYKGTVKQSDQGTAVNSGCNPFI